jgi:hypothetical protein
MQMDKAAVAGLVAIPLLFGAQAANAITSDQVRSLTYEEVKGTGLANRCTELASSNGEISINGKNKFKIADLCLEPKSFQIEQEVNTRKKGGNSKGELHFLFGSDALCCLLTLDNSREPLHKQRRCRIGPVCSK